MQSSRGLRGNSNSSSNNNGDGSRVARKKKEEVPQPPQPKSILRKIADEESDGSQAIPESDSSKKRQQQNDKEKEKQLFLQSTTTTTVTAVTAAAAIATPAGRKTPPSAVSSTTSATAAEKPAVHSSDDSPSNSSPTTPTAHNASSPFARTSMPQATIVSADGDFIDTRLMDAAETGVVVVGVLGYAQAGKTSVLAALCGLSRHKHSSSSGSSSSSDDAESQPTSGIQVILESEHLLLVDTEAVFVQQPTDPNSSIDNRSLQLAMFLLTLCHVIVVVQDSVNDTMLLRLLAAAEVIKNRDEGDHREYCSDIVIVCNKLSDWELREMRRCGLSKTAVVEAFRKVVLSYRLRLLSVLLAPLQQQQQEDILPRASVNTILECFSHVRQFPKPLSGAEWMRNAARYWEVTKTILSNLHASGSGNSKLGGDGK